MATVPINSDPNFKFIDNLDITCTKYVWMRDPEDPNDLSYVNLFAIGDPTEPRQPIETTVLDIKPYLIGLSEITWNMDITAEQLGKANTFFEESDVSYELTGIKNNSFLVDFFGIYSDTNYIKYLFTIKTRDTNYILHKGLSSQELIEITYSADVNSEILNITSLGYMKEFKNFYSKRELPHNDTELNWDRQQELPNMTYTYIYPTWGCSMRNLTAQLFPGINIIFDDEVPEWYIIKNPILTKRAGDYGRFFPDNTLWIKSSYERIRANGENRYDFIRKICNQMGWIFYFQNNSLYIKNRSPIETSVILDFNKVIECTLSKQTFGSDYENILINTSSIGVDAEFYGEGGYQQQRGECIKMFSSVTNIDSSRWWKNIGDSTSNWGINGRPSEGNDQKSIKFWREDDHEFWWIIWKNYQQVDSFHSVLQNNTLRIDGGNTGEHAWQYGSDNGSNQPAVFNFEPPNRCIIFRGGYGSAMFKLIDNDRHAWTYEDQARPNSPNNSNCTNFINNFKKFYRSKLSNTVTVKYAGVITDPLQNYTFINCPSNIILGNPLPIIIREWSTVSLKVDLIEETSILELQLKENTFHF